MVKHVVMWRYRNKADIGIAIKELESLRGRIPEVVSMEIGVNHLESPASYDLVLITEHENQVALDAYQADELHGEVKAILGKLESERVVVDYKY